MANLNYYKVSDLPVGAKIILGKNKFNGKYENGEEDISWVIVSKDHSKLDFGYPENAVTLLAENVIRYMAFDAKEPTNALEMRRNFGNPRWRTSNIRQWLNSNGFASQWYVPQNLGLSGTDNADTSPIAENLLNVARNYPYFADEGFMRSFSELERRALLPANITTVIPIDSEGQNPSTPIVETTTDYFYLPSYTEVTGANFVYNVNFPNEGFRVIGNQFRNAKATQLALSNGSSYTQSLLVNKDYAYRTSANNSELLKYFDDGSNGSYAKVKPYDNLGIRPMTNIKSSSVVVETTTSGVYRLVDNAKPYVVIDSIGTEQDGYDVNFTAYDYDDNIETITIQLNNEVVKTYSIGNLNNYSDKYIVNYNKLFFGVNTLIIKARDTRGLETTKTLKLELKSLNAVKNGDKIATRDGVYTIVETNIANGGLLELTLDRNLKSTNLTTDIVEKYKTEYVPHAFIGDSDEVVPQYTKMSLQSIDYQNDGTAIEEWQLIGVGSFCHTKVELSRKEVNSNDNLKKVSQMFTYYED